MPLPLAIVAGAALIGGATIFSTMKSADMAEKAQAQGAQQQQQMMDLIKQQNAQGAQNLPILLSMLQQGNQQSAYLSQFTGVPVNSTYAQLPQLLAGQNGITLPGAAGQQQPMACTCGGHGMQPNQPAVG